MFFKEWGHVGKNGGTFSSAPSPTLAFFKSSLPPTQGYFVPPYWKFSFKKRNFGMKKNQFLDTLNLIFPEKFGCPPLRENVRVLTPTSATHLKFWIPTHAKNPEITPGNPQKQLCKYFDEKLLVLTFFSRFLWNEMHSKHFFWYYP